MKYLFQFGWILAFCLAGEILHFLLPLPIPSSIYGLVLLLFALLNGWLKLEQIRETALFLTSIFPLLFVPSGTGIMDLWPELKAMLSTAIISAIFGTAIVIIVAGYVTQFLIRITKKRQKS